MREDDASLGAQLRRRRGELSLTLFEASQRLGADAKSLSLWERGAREPIVCMYPAIVRFLGVEPWPAPTRLKDALLAVRRQRGLEIRKAAAFIGVDEGTWARWERGEWKPTRLTKAALDRLLGVDVATTYPDDVR